MIGSRPPEKKHIDIQEYGPPAEPFGCRAGHVFLMTLRSRYKECAHSSASWLSRILHRLLLARVTGSHASFFLSSQSVSVPHALWVQLISVPREAETWVPFVMGVAQSYGRTSPYMSPQEDYPHQVVDALTLVLSDSFLTSALSHVQTGCLVSSCRAWCSLKWSPATTFLRDVSAPHSHWDLPLTRYLHRLDIAKNTIEWHVPLEAAPFVLVHGGLSTSSCSPRCWLAAANGNPLILRRAPV